MKMTVITLNNVMLIPFFLVTHSEDEMMLEWSPAMSSVDSSLISLQEFMPRKIKSYKKVLLSTTGWASSVLYVHAACYSSTSIVRHVVPKILFILKGKRHAILELNIQLDRTVGSYIQWPYVPTCMVMAASWVSLWMSPRAAGTGRALLSVLCLLAVLALHYASEQSMPRVAYMKVREEQERILVLFPFPTPHP